MEEHHHSAGLGPDVDLYVGMDIGSSLLHYAVLEAEKKVVYSPPPIMHFANPNGAVAEAWADLAARLGSERFVSTAFTGSGAEAYPRVMAGLIYVHDSVAIPAGIELACPDASHCFYIGAKDSYFFNLRSIDGKRIMRFGIIRDEDNIPIYTISDHLKYPVDHFVS